MEIHSQEEFELFKNYWFKKQPDKKSLHKDAPAYIIPYYCAYDKCGDKYNYHNKNVYTTHKLITIEQFKKHILMEKKIIGYKCPMDLTDNTGKVTVPKHSLFTKVEEHYRASTIDKYFGLPKEIVEIWEPVYEEQFKIGGWVSFYSEIERKIITSKIKMFGSSYHYLENGMTPFAHLLRKATPEEIEQATTKIVRMGGENGFDLTIKDNKVFHHTEDITSYVEAFRNYNIVAGNLGYSSKKGSGNWAFIVKDVILSKTGCEQKETKLSEWINVYKMIKNENTN